VSKELDKLNPFFRETFTSLENEYFLPNENIYWLGGILVEYSSKILPQAKKAKIILY